MLRPGSQPRVQGELRVSLTTLSGLCSPMGLQKGPEVTTRPPLFASFRQMGSLGGLNTRSLSGDKTAFDNLMIVLNSLRTLFVTRWPPNTGRLAQ